MLLRDDTIVTGRWTELAADAGDKINRFVKVEEVPSDATLPAAPESSQEGGQESSQEGPERPAIDLSLQQCTAHVKTVLKKFAGRRVDPVSRTPVAQQQYHTNGTPTLTTVLQRQCSVACCMQCCYLAAAILLSCCWPAACRQWCQLLL